MLHLDSGEIKTWDKLPNGSLRILSTVARTGWLEYTNPINSETYWEYVSPEVLFDPKHLDSLQGTTITLGHPNSVNRKVEPSTWHKYAVGIGSTQILPNKEKGIIDTISIIGDQRGIDAILKDGYRDLSEGYFAPTKLRTDSKDGCRALNQLYREANHFAICQQGRAGNAKLHIDSKTEYVYQTGWDKKNEEQYFFINNNSTKTKPKENPWQILSVTL